MAKRAILLLFLIVLSIILTAFINPIPEKNIIEGYKPKYGTSYSFEQAAWYGLDPRKSYVELLDTFKFDWVRLPFFWDQMVDSNGNLKIGDLMFAIEEAKKRNVKVVIALGLKTPYYPEYHLPESIASQMQFADKVGLNHPVADDLLALDRKLVTTLSKYDNISYWQVENEPYLANVNGWKIERDLIAAEIDIVREADIKKRPIILNHVGPTIFDNQYKQLLPLLMPQDVFSVNAYFKTQGVNLFAFKLFGKKVSVDWPRWLVWPVQSWTFFSVDFGDLKKEVEGKGIKFWVLEMQAEPYIRDLESAQSNDFSFSLDDVWKADTYLRSFRIEAVGLWGAPFWQFRQKAADSSWVDAVKGITN